MTTEDTEDDITTGAQRAVFQAFHRKVDDVLLERLLVRVAGVPYDGDFEAYVAVVVEVVRATLRPLIDRLTFECMATSPTIQ